MTESTSRSLVVATVVALILVVFGVLLVVIVDGAAIWVTVVALVVLTPVVFAGVLRWLGRLS